MSERLPSITCDELLRILKKLGFEPDRQRGSHLVLFHPISKRRTTVAMHRGKIIPNGTLKSILRDADISVDTLRSLL